MSARTSHHEPHLELPIDAYEPDSCGCECALPFLTEPQFEPWTDSRAEARTDAAHWHDASPA